MKGNLIMLNLNDLIMTDKVPAPFEPGAELWNDPHISRMMLEAHLSPDTDAASYIPSKVQAICEYLTEAMGLKKGDAIVDLGCGPGLYSALLADRSCKVTGIDRSENSIQYARQLTQGKDAEFIVASYLEPFGTSQFDAALLIYQDYGVLSPDNRKILLGNIRQALKPNGFFALDVSSLAAFESRTKNAGSKWYASEAGFWRPHPHFVLERTVTYPDIPVLCDQYVVIDSVIKSYYNYQTYFSQESICSELEENGFQVKEVMTNLWGEKYDTASPQIGIICAI